MGIFGVETHAEAEFIEKKSRFIGYSFPAATEEEARGELAALRKAHPFATHVCYAFIADRTGVLARFSDDGEPQGTAGVPILEVIKARGLKETAVAVVRYFGGVKLGAGGLVRAYAHAAALALDANRVVETSDAAFLAVTFSYELSDVFRRFAEKEGYAALTFDYGASVTARFAVRREIEGEVSAKITDYLQGKCEVKTERYSDFRFL